MPKQRELETNIDPSSTQQVEDNVPTGNKLLGLLATFTGSNDTGQSISQDDLGTVVLELYERQRFRTDLGFWASYPRLHHGATDKNSAGGGAFDITCFIPMGYPHEPNALPVERDSDVRYSFQYDNAAISTDTTSVSTDIRAVYAPRVAYRYIPEYRESTLQFNSGTSIDEEYNSPNLSDLWIREAGSNANANIISNVRIEQDNSVETDTVNDDQIEDLSIITEESPVSGEPWRHQSLMDGPASAGGYQNGQTTLEVTTSASGDVKAVRHIRRPAGQG
jgi:hypothetical protein